MPAAIWNRRAAVGLDLDQYALGWRILRQAARVCANPGWGWVIQIKRCARPRDHAGDTHSPQREGGVSWNGSASMHIISTGRAASRVCHRTARNTRLSMNRRLG